MSETENVIASVFKRVGKPSMSESEFVLALSFGFRWCPPEPARRFVRDAIARGLMKEEDGVLVPMFDVESHELPAMYSPPEEVFREGAKRDVLEQVLSRLPIDRDAAIREIEDTHAQLKRAVHREVAALLVAKKHQIDVDDLIDECMQQILG